MFLYAETIIHIYKIIHLSLCLKEPSSSTMGQLCHLLLAAALVILVNGDLCPYEVSRFQRVREEEGKLNEKEISAEGERE